MRRVVMFILMLVSSGICVMAQNISDIELVMQFLGKDDPQELDPEEVERLSSFLEMPLDINRCGESGLKLSGLYNPYQVAVIIDYRSRHGDILSLLELSFLDGFGESFVTRIRPFVIFTPSDGKLEAKTVHELSARLGYRWRRDEGSDGSYGIKYRMDSGGKYTFTTAVSRSAGAASWVPSAMSGSFAWRFARNGGQLLVGDFNARFGQGLTLWNGMFMTSLTTPDTFMKKPSGLSQMWSFTGSTALTGIAAEFLAGSFRISSMLVLPGVKNLLRSPEDLQVMPALNVVWQGRYGQASVTNVAVFSPYADECQFRTGVDGAFCIRGVNIFGEVMADWAALKVKASAGARFGAGEHLDMAVQLRAYQGDHFGSAAGCEFNFGRYVKFHGKEGFGASRQVNKGSFTVDASFYPVSKDPADPWSLQLKSLLVWDLLVHPRWQVKVRISERVRTWGNPFRTDLRADVSYDMHPFDLTLRLNLLKCDGTGLLSYLEGGYKGRKLNLYLRQGFFLIDDWDDRIYVYEHDAPGSFNSPVMYGRGLWVSAAGGLRLSSRLRLYMRASYTCYPFMEQEKKKPGKAELKLQLQCRF